MFKRIIRPALAVIAIVAMTSSLTACDPVDNPPGTVGPVDYTYTRVKAIKTCGVGRVAKLELSFSTLVLPEDIRWDVTARAIGPTAPNGGNLYDGQSVDEQILPKERLDIIYEAANYDVIRWTIHAEQADGGGDIAYEDDIIIDFERCPGTPPPSYGTNLSTTGTVTRHNI